MRRRLLLLGFVIILLIAIPLTVFIIKQQTKPTKAAAATRLEFVIPPDPITVGQKFTLDIKVDPGNVNVISFVKLVISYNKTKLKGLDIKKNDSVFGVKLEGPTLDQCPTANTCNMIIAMAIDPNSGQPIRDVATIASATFQALASTDAGPTIVAFDNGTQVLSLATTDSPSENVLIPSGSTPASITINALPTGTPSPTGNPTDTPIPSPTGTTGGGGGTSPSPAGGNKAPACTSLAADVSSGNPPLAVNFTVAGSDSDGTVNKISFNFGDGAVQDLTSGGGIGTASISTSSAHTYSVNGTFTATATLTDDQGSTSNPATCSQTITVGSGGGTTATATPTPASVTPTPSTLPPTGPGQIVVGAGLAGVVLSVLGGLLIFGL